MVYLLSFLCVFFLICLLAKPERWFCRIMEFIQTALKRKFDR